MKKKYVASPKDKKDWIDFTKRMNNISIKEVDFPKHKVKKDIVKKIDLHGLSLIEANDEVKNFIIESYNFGYRKILIVTGKGSRSKAYNNPYLSDKLSVLKYSVPEYINNNKNLVNKIIKISKTDIKDKGNGAFYIYLKNKEKFKE